MKKFSSTTSIILAISLLIIAIMTVIGGIYFTQSTMPKIEEETYAKPNRLDRQVRLLPEDTYLVDSMTSSYVDTGVANRTDEPLLVQVTRNELDLNWESPVWEMAHRPWFYGSPNVEDVSEHSKAQRAPLISEESVNAFTWHDMDGQLRLFQEGKPYTGFHGTRFSGWRYFIDGKMQEFQISYTIAKQMAINRQIISDLTPLRQPNVIYFEPTGGYTQFSRIIPVNYPILYKNEEALILTSPPGTKDSRLKTTTDNFYEIPMDVVEEVTTYDGTWLHVYVGYDELGWIKKDDTRTDYVPTYYSERDMLDAIAAVLEEQISYIDARVGASFVNNETMSQISVNNQVFFPASTQKIYVLGEVYRQYALGELNPYETYVTLTNADKVPGAGIIVGYPEGSVFSVDELVNLVVIYSDNTAANLLIDLVGGGDVLNPHVHQLGLYDTYITGKYYSDSTYFTTTPADAARYFALLYNDQLNGEPYDEQLINKFALNTHTFLRMYLWDVNSWNKSGLGGTEQNDVATFVTPYGSYSLAVYTAEPWYYDGIGEQVGSLSVHVHDTFNAQRALLWETVEESNDSILEEEYIEDPYVEEVYVEEEYIEDEEAFEW